MLGKKVFFIKDFVKLKKVSQQIDFEEYLSVYTQDKLNAIVNNEIHNDRNEEKALSGVHFTVTYKSSGQLVNKEILERVLLRFKHELRDTDILVEFGEGELILLLPECSIESAHKVAFLQKSIIESKVYDDKHLEVNFSLTLHKDSDNVESFLTRLDAKAIA